MKFGDQSPASHSTIELQHDTFHSNGHDRVSRFVESETDVRVHAHVQAQTLLQCSASHDKSRVCASMIQGELLRSVLYNQRLVKIHTISAILCSKDYDAKFKISIRLRADQ